MVRRDQPKVLGNPTWPEASHLVMRATKRFKIFSSQFVLASFLIDL